MTDQYLTRDKTLEVTCVGHASIMMRYGEQIIHVDPYGDVADYGQLPDADLILITHHHGDHFDTLAIAEIERPTTQIIGSPTVIRELKRGKALRNGSQTVWNEIPIRAVPAYNRISMRSPGVPFHIRGEGNGYLLEIERLRIYIAGDTGCRLSNRAAFSAEECPQNPGNRTVLTSSLSFSCAQAL